MNASPTTLSGRVNTKDGPSSLGSDRSGRQYRVLRTLFLYRLWLVVPETEAGRLGAC